VDKPKPKRRDWAVDVVAWLILLAGIAAGYGNLRGWFRHTDRAGVVRWMLESETGLPLAEPGAVAFTERFPPPAETDERTHGRLTHLTKTMMKSTGGGRPVGGFVTYMHADTTRTGSAATLDDVRRWAEETPYPWLSLALTALGATLTIGRGIATKRRLLEQP